MSKQTADFSVNVLILGGGLTGLSAAYHLEKNKFTDYLLVEKNSFFGGLAASQIRGGFTFDYSGHLLHLHDRYATTLCKRLLRGNLQRLKRHASIDINGQRIPFPFQANLWALPQQMRQECVTGALAAARQPTRRARTFKQWCLQAFGEGIYNHFFRPYNTKLWQTDPACMTCDWCGDFVPRPDIKQITRGAKQPSKTAFGYNAHFYYPLQGGCGALAEAFAAHIPNTWLQATVQHIDLHNHQARINGKTIHFKQLLNTLPLPEFIHLCGAVPRPIQQAARQLTSTTVSVWQLAINRAVKPFHWIYFPDPEVPFFRVGMQSAFSPHNAPQNTSSFYIETTVPLTHRDQVEKAILKTLQQKGIIEKQDKILQQFWYTISPAYAGYDAKRFAAQHRIVQWLKRQACVCAGRYGLWEYSFMERGILQGRDAAAYFISVGNK